MALLVFALISRGQAVSAQAVAKSRALAAESQTELSADPELSILLAIQAVRASATPQAMYAVREAIDQSPLRRQLPARGNQWCTDLSYDEESPAIAYAPSGRQIAEVACDGKLTILDDATGRVHARWDVGTQADAIAYSPDGRTLAVAAEDGITLLNAATGKVLRTLTPQSNKPLCVGGGPCTGSGGPPFCAPGQVATLGTIPVELAFSPDGTRLAVSFGFSLDIWQLHGGSVPRVVGGASGCIEGMGFNRSGGEILVADNADVGVVDAASGRLLGVRPALPGDRSAGQGYPVVGRLAVSPDGRYVAAAIGFDANNSGEVELFNAAPWRRLATVAYSPDAPITGLAFSPDSSRLAIGTGDGAAGIWSVASDRELLPLSGHITQITSIAWRPDGGELATTSDDGEGLVWRASLGQGTTIATGAGLALAAANTRGDRVWAAFASPAPGAEVLRSWTAGAPVKQIRGARTANRGRRRREPGQPLRDARRREPERRDPRSCQRPRDRQCVRGLPRDQPLARSRSIGGRLELRRCGPLRRRVRDAATRRRVGHRRNVQRWRVRGDQRRRPARGWSRLLRRRDPVERSNRPATRDIRHRRADSLGREPEPRRSAARDLLAGANHDTVRHDDQALCARPHG